VIKTLDDTTMALLHAKSCLHYISKLPLVNFRVAFFESFSLLYKPEIS